MCDHIADVGIRYAPVSFSPSPKQPSQPPNEKNAAFCHRRGIDVDQTPRNYMHVMWGKIDILVRGSQELR
jgi:hypothetical protein